LNLQRLLIDRMENRILVGITMFLATMVLVGWVAINEPGRMAAFQQQHLARSVEKGAELYASNCAECHGPLGLGGARAPGLNNPFLFGIDFFEPIDSEIARLETLKAEVETIETTLAGDTSSLTSTEIEGLENRLAELQADYGESALAGLDEAIATQAADRGALETRLATAVERGYAPEFDGRLDQVDWLGTLESFVLTTLVSGRPVSSSYWPEPMAAWSQTAGGPLRDDQLQDLTNYVLNWGHERQWTVEDLLAVQQFAKVPVEDLGMAADFEAVAPDVVNIQSADVTSRRADIDVAWERITQELGDVVGDPNNGQTLYNGSMACSACHANVAVAPPTEGTWTRVNETRLNDPALAGYTPEHYVIESIIAPNAYIAPNYPANAMPNNFGERLNMQMLADLLAYIQSQDGEDPLAG
jgi:mono/diheme cytochrome c family protein